MLSTRITSYENNGWIKFTSSSILLSADTYSYWIENDQFYLDLVYSFGGNIIFEIIGTSYNSKLVHNKLNAMKKKLENILKSTGLNKTISIVFEDIEVQKKVETNEKQKLTLKKPVESSKLQ